MIGRLGRADFLRSLAIPSSDAYVTADTVAAALGYLRIAEANVVIDVGSPGVSQRDVGDDEESKSLRVAAPIYRPADIPFLVLTQFRQSEHPPEPPPHPGLTPEHRRPRSARRATHPSLLPWSRLWPRLRAVLRREQERPVLDVEKLVERLSRCEHVARLPRRRDPVLPNRLWLVVDRNPRLHPIYPDLAEVQERLASHFGRRSLHVWSFDNGPDERPRIEGRRVKRAAFPPAASVLVLGDLGAYGDPLIQAEWTRFARSLHRHNRVVHALLPAPKWRWPARTIELDGRVQWDRTEGPALSDSERTMRAERLLRLLSPAVRVEPSLLRAVRLLLPVREADVGTEFDAWHHPKVHGGTAIACTIVPSVADPWRAVMIASESTDLVSDVVARVRRHHAHLEREFDHSETMTLHSLDPRLVTASELDEAREFYLRLRFTPEGVRSAQGDFLRRDDRRMPKSVYDDPVIGSARRAMFARYCAIDSHAPPPPNFVPVPVDLPARRFRIEQVSETIAVRSLETEDRAAANSASLLGFVDLAGDDLTVQRAAERGERKPLGLVETTFDLGDLQAGSRAEAPPWAVAHGHDEHGEWADDEIAGVRVRFRFIRPGTFQMGSPLDEPGRDDDETPHPVTLTQGFWIADTAVTQQLYSAVVGTNPSRFKGANRPVENVSWNDADAFLKKLRESESGFDLRLPTEAEWEYSCRAGTSTPFSFGPNVDSEMVNYHGSYPYADGRKGKYRQQTVEVKTLPANPWGLFEMHGNVWEWCSDWRGRYPTDSATDPIGPAGGSARVLRGGSWISDAGSCRSASRGWDSPGTRYDSIGFRLARGPVPRQASQDGALDRGQAVRGAERRRPARDRSAQSNGAGLQIVTDRGVWKGEVWTKPKWASAMGRDAFGLWCEVEIGAASFRMRWISPGQFKMGSPPEEPGRYDHEIQHDVVLTRGYWLAETPCTQSVWQAVSEENPSRFKSPDRPVEMVSFEDVEKFLLALARRTGDGSWRLPTEAQWEYACRAGTSTSTYLGNARIERPFDDPMIAEIGWYGGNSHDGFDLAEGVDIGADWKRFGEESLKRWGLLESIPALIGRKGGTHPVGRKVRNGFGLFDMLGNVLEWCSDWHAHYSTERQIDPSGPSQGSDRVLRGGSWFDDAGYCRSASRYWLSPDSRNDGIGFRLARGPESSPAPEAQSSLDSSPPREGRPREDSSRTPQESPDRDETK